MREWTISDAEAGVRIDVWLTAREDVGSRARAREWIERGKVFLNGSEVTFRLAGTRLQPGDVVAVWPDRPGSSRAQSRDVVSRRSALHIVYEDDVLLVANKPAGLLVEPLPGEHDEVTLRDLVADHLRAHGLRQSPSSVAASHRSAAEAFVVHRIDRDTTGLVLFAKDARAQAVLKRQFERRTAERVYLAVMSGRLREPEGTWTNRLVWDKTHLVQRGARDGDEAAKQAVAAYRVVEQFEKAALVEVRLVTGKRNQIRVQARLHGHPLVGERIYVRRSPGARATSAERPAFPRQALHAAHLGFRHPSTGARVDFTAPLPPDLARLVASLRSSLR